MLRDVILTVVVVWVIWKILEAFKTVSKTRPQTQGFNTTGQNYTYQKRKEGEVRIDRSEPLQKPHFKPEDGEYVDYEEIK